MLLSDANIVEVLYVGEAECGRGRAGGTTAKAAVARRFSLIIINDVRRALLGYGHTMAMRCKLVWATDDDTARMAMVWPYASSVRRTSL